MAEINFFQEDISYQIEEEETLKAWVKKVITNEGFSPGEVNYILCSDEYLHKINQEYLDHDTFTDIVTFDMSEDKEEISADIFISIDRIKENAVILKTKEQDELHRVLIHGILHLIGFNDGTPDEKSIMRKKEEACLSLR
ncbi:MAG: rRNA maturation RNase YbeY [Fulvivirga sp.]